MEKRHEDQFTSLGWLFNKKLLITINPSFVSLWDFVYSFDSSMYCTMYIVSKAGSLSVLRAVLHNYWKILWKNISRVIFGSKIIKRLRNIKEHLQHTSIYWNKNAILFYSIVKVLTTISNLQTESMEISTGLLFSSATILKT